MRIGTLKPDEIVMRRLFGDSYVEFIEGDDRQCVLFMSLYLKDKSLGGGKVQRQTRKRPPSVKNYISSVTKVLRNIGFDAVKYTEDNVTTTDEATSESIFDRDGYQVRPGIVYARMKGATIDRDYARILLGDPIEGIVSAVYDGKEVAVSAWSCLSETTSDDVFQDTEEFSLITLEDYIVIKADTFREASKVVDYVLNKPWGESLNAIKELTRAASSIIFEDASGLGE